MHAFLNTNVNLQARQKCTKIPWPSRRQALNVLQKHTKDKGLTCVGNGKLDAYKCKMCGEWHLGHS